MHMPVSEYELELLAELENPPRKKSLLNRLGTGKSARIGALMRILSLIKGLPDEALPPPPPPPPIVKKIDPTGQGEFESESLAETAMLMEYLGHAATQTESEAEAAAFIGALLPIAAEIFPSAAPALIHSSPNLLRGLVGATRILRRDPATRSLVCTLPTILRRTAANMKRQISQGVPVTQRTSMISLAKEMHRILSSSEQTQQVVQRSQTARQRYGESEIEHMAGGNKQMTSQQKKEILEAIDECLKKKEHTKGGRSSTKQTHQQGMARKRQDKWNRAQRIFQNQGFPAALNDAKRC